MLSKNARKILKIAKKSKEKTVFYPDLKKELEWDYDAIKSACSQLIQADLADEKYHSPIPGQKVPWGIVLTERGRNSKKYFWFDVFSFLFKSIAVPIFVSIITAIITTILTTKFLAIS